MSEPIYQILGYVATYAGAVATWLVSSKIRHVRQAKEVHDAYKVMYEDLRETLTQVVGETAAANEKKDNEVYLLKKIIRKLVGCRYANQCPAYDELRAYTGGHSGVARRAPSKKTRSSARSDTSKQGGDDTNAAADDKPP